MPDYYSRYCNKCERMAVGHAFSEGECTMCKEEVRTSHTPCDKVCRDCSIKENVCMSCGETLYPIFKEDMEKFAERELKDGLEDLISKSSTDAAYDLLHPPSKNRTEIEYLSEEESLSNIRSITSIEELSIQQIISKYGIECILDNTNNVKTISNYIDKIVDEKEQLESLIDAYRWKMKDKLDEDFSKVMEMKDRTAWTDPISEQEVQEFCNSIFQPLTEFDEHFKITKQREGNIE